MIPSAIPRPIPWAIRSPIALEQGGGEAPVTWADFISGLTATQVLDVNFAETDRHFQSRFGPTLADDAGENIALAMDDAAWGGLSLAVVAAAATELVVNGTFDANITNWTAFAAQPGSGWDAGRMKVVGTAGSQGYYQDVSGLTAAQTYVVAGTVETDAGAVNSGALSSRVGGSMTSIVEIATAAPGASQTSFKYITGQTGIRVYGVAGYLAVAGLAWFDNISCKLIVGNHGVQATSSLQGKRQAGGVCRYDGTDDNHLTTFLAQNGAMSLLYHGTVAASLAATQMVLGASGSSANRCWLAITTGGFIAAGVGSDSTATIVGTTDVRGKTIVAAVTFDGSTVKLFLRVDGVTTEEYSAAQASTPTTAIPFRIGAYNNNGTAAGFADVDAKRISAAHKVMALSEFTSIAAAWAA